MSAVSVGRRYIHKASDDGCTLRFIGPLAVTNETANPVTWLGVEWDDPSRGKHSGEYQGVQYFKTRRPGAGSFLRLPKDWNQGGDLPLRAGPTFWDAVAERYLVQDEMQHEVTLGSSNGLIKVEVPNIERVAKRIKNVGDIREIGLERSWVSSAGEAPSGVKLEHLHTLDLSHNLLPSWRDLAEICRQLPSVQRLIVNYSRFAPLEEQDQAECAAAFANLEELHLASCGLSWQEARELWRIFPSVHTLSLAANPLQLEADMQESASAWQQLRHLDLSRCDLQKWEDIARCFGSLDHLHTLNLSSNAFTTIPSPPAYLATGQALFPELHAVFLLRSRISSFLSLELLDDLLGSRLQELRFSVLEESPGVDESVEPMFRTRGSGDGRAAVIASLQGLTVLDGTEVTVKQRLDAERYIVSKMTQAGRPAAAITRRFEQLCHAHQTQAERALPASSASTLRDKMLNLRIQPDPGLSDQAFELAVLPSVPLRVLKIKIVRKIPGANSAPALCFHTGHENRVLDLDELDRTVDWLGLVPGDVISVKGIP